MRMNPAASCSRLLLAPLVVGLVACVTSAQEVPQKPVEPVVGTGTAQTPDAPTPPAPPALTPDQRTARRELRQRVKEAEADLAQHVTKFAPHVVRVQTWSEMVSKRVDGVEYDRRRINGVQGNGIIVRADPLILVSGSIAEVDLPRLPDPVAPSPFSEFSPDRYEVLTLDNRAVAAEVVARDDELNMMLLRPIEPDDAPAEWKIDLPIAHGRRPAASSHVGITLFTDPYRDGSLNAYVVHVPDGKDAFRRPALPGIGRYQLGLPLFDRTGNLVAVVGIASKSTPVPAWATDPERRLERPTDRDPNEYENGRRKAVLVTIDELRPLLERWFATNFGEVPFEGFGFSLRDGDRGIQVSRVVRGGAGAAADLRVGDVVVTVEGTDVASTDAFAEVLERSLGVDSRVLRLGVRRGSQVVELEIDVP